MKITNFSRLKRFPRIVDLRIAYSRKISAVAIVENEPSFYIFLIMIPDKFSLLRTYKKGNPELSEFRKLRRALLKYRILLHEICL